MSTRPNAITMLLPGGVLLLLAVVEREVLSAVVVHPLAKVVGNVECPMVIGSKLVVYEDQGIPVTAVLSDKNTYI